MASRFIKQRVKVQENSVEPERPTVSAVVSPTTGVPLEGHQLRKSMRREALAAEIQANLEKRKASQE